VRASSIREATNEDVDTLAALFAAARAAAMPWLPVLHTADEDRAWIRDVLIPNNEVLVVERNGVLAGFAAIGAAMLEQLYVHPDHQGVGVGGELLDEAKRRRPEGLDLWVFQRNERARRFYEARGFRLVELTDGAGNEEREPDARYSWP
jgi:ribosomal protein S18 acetylase RimI-like enzyme